MDELAFILDRRSIRRFTDQRIDNKIIEKLLLAAMYAPSAVNKQPWHFVVVDRRDMLDRFMEIHPYAGMLQTASHGIVICGDEILQHDDGYWVVDCGAATQNLLLAAHTLGLGSCWVGLHPREGRKASFSELLELPEHVKPFALVALGYPDERKLRPERFHPNKVKLNGWGHPYF
ncbi:MAG: nitroreductase family protein [Bacteroidales bacterium]|nr:nitroreductase family protein [Bacteroidales bacterium]